LHVTDSLLDEILHDRLLKLGVKKKSNTKPIMVAARRTTGTRHSIKRQGAVITGGSKVRTNKIGNSQFNQLQEAAEFALVNGRPQVCHQR
jgi:hypothetical protein